MVGRSDCSGQRWQAAQGRCADSPTCRTAQHGSYNRGQLWLVLWCVSTAVRTSYSTSVCSTLGMLRREASCCASVDLPAGAGGET